MQMDAFEAAKAIWEDTGRRVKAFGDPADKELPGDFFPESYAH
jgi:hypothetical protein